MFKNILWIGLLIMVFLVLVAGAAPTEDVKDTSAVQKPVVEFKLPPYRALDVAPKEPRDRAKVAGKSDYCLDCLRGKIGETS